MYVLNECRVDFKYRLSPQGPIISQTVESNMVRTYIICNILDVIKMVDKKETYPFDILTYTIIIKNVSQFVATDVFFQDNIPKGTQFIVNSVTVNNIKKRCVNPQIGFSIGNIKEESTVKVTFKVVVLPSCFCKCIKNYSTIEYGHIYNIEKPPGVVGIETNRVTTKCNKKVFKQISVDNTIQSYNPIYNITKAEYYVDIIEIKVINSPINCIYEKTHDTNLCTLLIIGTIECRIVYETIFKREKIKYLIKDIFGFSCCMIVPVGIDYVDKDNINLDIENISTTIVNKNIIFVNANLLLYY